MSTAVADAEVVVAPSSTLFYSSTTPSGETMSVMDLDTHGVIVLSTTTSTIAVSSPHVSVVSVTSGCAIQEMQVIVL